MLASTMKAQLVSIKESILDMVCVMRVINRVVDSVRNHKPKECSLQGTILVSRNIFNSLSDLSGEINRVQKLQKTKIKCSIASTTILAVIAVSLLAVTILLGSAAPCIAGVVFVGIFSGMSFKKIHKNHQYFKPDQIAPLNLLQGIEGLNEENLLEKLKEKYQAAKEDVEKNSYAMMALAYHLSKAVEQEVGNDEVGCSWENLDRTHVKNFIKKLKGLKEDNFRIVAMKNKDNDNNSYIYGYEGVTFLQIRDEAGSNEDGKEWLSFHRDWVFEDGFSFFEKGSLIDSHRAPFDLRRR